MFKSPWNKVKGQGRLQLGKAHTVCVTLETLHCSLRVSLASINTLIPKKYSLKCQELLVKSAQKDDPQKLKFNYS